MPHLHDTVEGIDNINAFLEHNSFLVKPPFEERDLSGAKELRIICSDFKDPGDDWCRYDLFTKDGVFIASREVPGH